MTEGENEAFWRRFDATLEANNWKSLRDFVNDCNLGISYWTVLSMRSRKELPTMAVMDKITRSLNTSLDYLIYGYYRGGKVLTDEEAELLARYRKANQAAKDAINSILN